MVDVCSRMARTLFRALIYRDERNKNQSVVGGAAPAETESHDRKGPKDIFVLADEFYCVVRNVRGVGERSAGRRLHNADQVILVFCRQEGGRNVLIKIDRCCQATDKEHQHHIPQPQHLLDGLPVQDCGANNSTIDQSQKTALVLLSAQKDRRQRR